MPEKLEEYSSPLYMPEGLGRKPSAFFWEKSKEPREKRKKKQWH
jgi:hypothetical protein